MPDVKVIIIGAGFGGIAAAIELRQHGFKDVTILDRAAESGGTWYHNNYPGSACDVPSYLYSFSFAQRAGWTRFCSSQSEILTYLRDVAHEFGVDRRIVPNADVSSCTWNEATASWTISSADGRTWEANAVVLATGQLHRASYPSIEGRDLYAGHSFHSSSWDHDFDLSNRRVAVIGSGSSVAQFVPAIAGEVQRLIVFQRTPNWFLPRKNHHCPRAVRTLMRFSPLRALVRFLIAVAADGFILMMLHPKTIGRLGQAASLTFMRRQTKDPVLFRKVRPDYSFGCKRIVFSSFFLRTLQRPNVDLVTEPIARLTPSGIVTSDGLEREVDCIIYGTGFHASDFMLPMDIVGIGGRTLRESWADGPHAHLGIAVPGFPSLFLMYGPNTNTPGGSVIVLLEAQASYLRQALEFVRSHGAAAVDVRPSVEADSDSKTQARFTGTAWTNCDSWYRSRDGRNVANWPDYMRNYVTRTRTYDPGEYVLVPRSGDVCSDIVKGDRRSPLQSPDHLLR